MRGPVPYLRPRLDAFVRVTNGGAVGAVSARTVSTRPRGPYNRTLAAWAARGRACTEDDESCVVVAAPPIGAYCRSPLLSAASVWHRRWRGRAETRVHGWPDGGVAELSVLAVRVARLGARVRLLLLGDGGDADCGAALFVRSSGGELRECGARRRKRRRQSVRARINARAWMARRRRRLTPPR